MFAYFEKEISWAELTKRTVKDSIHDDAAGIAAQLSYYFFLALFPALLFLVALASFFPLYNLTDELMRLVSPLAPAAVVRLLQDQLAALSNSEDAGLLSVGLLMALWSSSAAMVSVIDAMDRAYDIEDSRHGGGAGSSPLRSPSGWPFSSCRRSPSSWPGRGSPIGSAATSAFLLASTGFGIVYYFAPDAEQEWTWITPGAFVATLLWVIASLAFRFYVVNFGNYEEAYGTLGGIILTLLWFYITALVMVLGAEMNAEIHRASPWGRNPGPTIVGEKKRIGLAASRHWRRLHT
jgi:membrane protein